MAWPPKMGELWVSSDRWASSTESGVEINEGEPLIIVSDPEEAMLSGGPYYRFRVLGPLGCRKILAAQDDIEPVEQ